MNEDIQTTIIDADGRNIIYEPSSEERLLGMLLFLLNFFTAILGPLIIWLIKREESTFIDHHGKQYFNLLISFFIYEFIAAITIFIGIGLVLVPLLSIVFLILIIVGAIKAYQGEFYRFPFVIPLFK